MASERAVALVAARGPLQVAEIAAEVHPLLGHGWSRGGKPSPLGTWKTSSAPCPTSSKPST